MIPWLIITGDRPRNSVLCFCPGFNLFSFGVAIVIYDTQNINEIIVYGEFKTFFEIFETVKVLTFLFLLDRTAILHKMVNNLACSLIKYTLFIIRIYFIRILRLKFAKS